MPDEETTNESQGDDVPVATDNFTDADGNVFEGGVMVSGPDYVDAEIVEDDEEALNAGKVDDVLARVGDDAIDAAAVLALEQAADKPRKTLIEGLEAVIAAAEEGEGSGTDEAGEYVCAVHSKTMSPNPLGSRQRWTCGGGDGCYPEPVEA